MDTAPAPKPPPSPAGRVILALAATALLAIVLVSYYLARNLGELSLLGTPRLPSPELLANHGTADSQWRFRTVEGAERSFGELRGRAVFVNVWATWCGPCVEEMPAIGRLYESLREEGIEFVVVSEEDAEPVRAFLERYEFPFPVYLAGELPEVFRSRGIPATFIVDPAGTVVYKHVGAANWDSDEVRRFLRAVAARPHSGM